MTLPEVLPYAAIQDIGDVPELDDVYCYFVEDYDDQDGISVLVLRDEGRVALRVADFQSNLIDVSKEDHPNYTHISRLLTDDVKKAITVMRAIKLDQAQFFWAITDRPILVDLQVAINKFAGPGMLKELFGKVIQCQTILKIDHYKNQKAKSIIKPSSFKMMVRNDDAVPMYGRIR
jgi:hypothetical protein